MTRPDASAVLRQPKVASAQATSGTHSPPAAMPSCIVDSARARFFSNQWISETLSGKKPHRLAPSAVTMNAP
jgi:hypothetical protein